MPRLLICYRLSFSGLGCGISDIVLSVLPSGLGVPLGYADVSPQSHTKPTYISVPARKICKQDGLHGLRNVNITIVKEPERQLPKSKKRKAPPHPTKGAKKRATLSSFQAGGSDDDLSDEASDDEVSDDESSDNLEAARSDVLDDESEVSGDEALDDLEVVGSKASIDSGGSEAYVRPLELRDFELAAELAAEAAEAKVRDDLAAAGSGRVQTYLDRMEAMGWEVIRTPEVVAESEVAEVVAESEVKLPAIKTRDCQAVLHFTTIVRQ